MNLTNNNELHLENSITSIFNVEVSPRVCSFCHRFGHLLTEYPYRSSRVEVQPVLIVAFPSINHAIALVPNYPNLVPRNSGLHLGIRGKRGEFLRFLNPAKKSSSFSGMPWRFLGTGFHATLLAHYGTTLSRGETGCNTRMGLAKYDASKCGYTSDGNGQGWWRRPTRCTRRIFRTFQQKTTQRTQPFNLGM
jgi:hypothetical protein